MMTGTIGSFSNLTMATKAISSFSNLTMTTHLLSSLKRGRIYPSGFPQGYIQFLWVPCGVFKVSLWCLNEEDQIRGETRIMVMT